MANFWLVTRLRYRVENTQQILNVGKYYFRNFSVCILNLSFLIRVLSKLENVVIFLAILDYITEIIVF